MNTTTCSPRGSRIERSGRRRGLSGLLAVATAVVGLVLPVVTAAPASAEIACSNRDTSRTFQRIDGDTNNYFLVRNGRFEGSTNGWTLSDGARVVGGNEPWQVRGSADDQSVQLRGDDTLISPRLCVESNEETFRFFYYSPGVDGARLRVTSSVNSSGRTDWSAEELDGSRRGWRVSPPIEFPDARNRRSGEQWLQIRFETRGTTASWKVDDVHVDPWRSLR